MFETFWNLIVTVGDLCWNFGGTFQELLGNVFGTCFENVGELCWNVWGTVRELLRFVFGTCLTLFWVTCLQVLGNWFETVLKRLALWGELLGDCSRIVWKLFRNDFGTF